MNEYPSISDKRKFSDYQAELLKAQGGNSGMDGNLLERFFNFIFSPIKAIPIAFSLKRAEKHELSLFKKNLFIYSFFSSIAGFSFFRRNPEFFFITLLYGVSFGICKYETTRLLKQDIMAEQFLKIGLRDEMGFAPKVLKRTEKEILFLSPGIPLEFYSKKKSALESLLNCRIRRIVPSDTYDQVKLEISNTILPSYLEFDQTCIEVCLKHKECWLIGYDDEFVIKPIQEVINLLVSGSCGVGKSVLFRSGICSALLSTVNEGNIEIYGIDFKGMIEQQYFEPWCSAPIAGDAVLAGIIIDYAIYTLEERLDKFYRYGCKDIESYRDKVNSKEPRILIVGDEIADCLLCLEQLDKKQRNKFTYLEKIESLARRSRAAGISLFFATQYAERAIIPTQIKNNLVTRCIMKVQSDQASINLIGTDDCYNLPDIKGRFIYSTGGAYCQEMQSPYLSESTAVQILEEYVPKSPISPGLIEFLRVTGKNDIASQMVLINQYRGF